MLLDDTHGIADPNCNNGLCGYSHPGEKPEFPKKCHCGGFIHQSYSERNINDWIELEKCDKCGGGDIN